MPKNCNLVVEDNNGKSKKYHKNNEWIIFDDSKMHYAVNESNEERIILIIDFKDQEMLKQVNQQAKTQMNYMN